MKMMKLTVSICNFANT